MAATILAGLLNTQVDKVVAAYRRNGFLLAERKDSGDWPCLRLVKGGAMAIVGRSAHPGRTSQPPGDFGTWWRLPAKSVFCVPAILA